MYAIVQSGMWSGLRVTGQRLGNLLADLDRSALVLPLGLDALTPTSWHARYLSVSGCGPSLLIHSHLSLARRLPAEHFGDPLADLESRSRSQVHLNNRIPDPGSLIKPRESALFADTARPSGVTDRVACVD